MTDGSIFLIGFFGFITICVICGTIAGISITNKPLNRPKCNCKDNKKEK